MRAKRFRTDTRRPGPADRVVAWQLLRSHASAARETKYTAAFDAIKGTGGKAVKMTKKELAQVRLDASLFAHVCCTRSVG